MHYSAYSKVRLLSLFLIPFALIPFASLAESGHESSGGGTLVIPRPGDNPVLLDLLDEDVNFTDPRNPQQINELPNTPLLKISGFDRVKIETLAAFSPSINRLELWQSVIDPEVRTAIGLIRSSFLRTQFQYTQFRLKLISKYSVSADLQARFPDHALLSAVIYHPEYGARITNQFWNRLGTLSQSGLLIHEAFRNIQIGYGFTLSNDALQKLTALIVMRQPNAENIKVFKGLLPAEMLSSLQKLQFLDLFNETCARSARIHLMGLKTNESESKYCSDGKPRSSEQFQITRDSIDDFRMMANTLSDEMHLHPELSTQQLQLIDSWEWDLRTIAFNLRTQSVSGTLASLFDSASSLKVGAQIPGENLIRDFMAGKMSEFKSGAARERIKRRMDQLQQENLRLIASGYLVE